MSVSELPSHRCATCRSTLVNARNLAVFIDGTSNKPGNERTNVVKLYNMVSRGEDPGLMQRSRYLEGIGASDVDHLSLLRRVGKAIYTELEMALAWNVEKNVIKAYSWLAETYQEGDQIYLFGYSRGAYQVRALTGMIHEVGLVKEASQERSEQAYRRYISINPNDSGTRITATEFKKKFCWHGLRIHFVGVWDTVSSLGFIKKDVHITASASVTNACHFRHALALDDCRVKFLPEYFSEVNAHCIHIESPRSTASDVHEVWFAGSHSDVGGTSRRYSDVVPHPGDDDLHSAHAGNVTLLWMKREAVDSGLVFKPFEFSWDPEDVDLGREGDKMELKWKLAEILPIRHQVSFAGTGKHKSKWHLFRPRVIIPNQHVHSSVLSGDVYAPRAILGDGVGIPTVPRTTSGGLWVTELPNEGEMTRFLTSLLRNPQTALGSLQKVLFLLGSNNGQTETMDRSQWSEESTGEQSDQWSEEYIGRQADFTSFVLAIIYDITTNFSTSEELIRKARNSLCAILLSSNQPYLPRALFVLRFSARNDVLRRRFVTHEEVIRALLYALEWAAKTQSENMFPLIIDILCYLINDSDQRGYVINQLSAGSDLTGTRLSLVLEVKVPSHLVASLKMIVSLARYQSELSEELKVKITILAQKGCGAVGSAAVEALAALNEPLTRNIRFSNVLGYLDNTLLRLDAEVGNTSSIGDTGNSPCVLRFSAHKEFEEFMRKIMQTMESSCVRQRTLATFTLLKLCNHSDIRGFCLQNKVLEIFMKQMERKETSLLGVYALRTCLRHDMLIPDNFDSCRAAQLIVTMFSKGWLDDAVGQVEGSEIFRELMTSSNLRQQVIDAGIVTTIIKKFEGGEIHEVRMGKICLDILEREMSLELMRFVSETFVYLRHEKKKTQMKGVKILSALAETVAGERVIKPHVINIVTMLLPRAGRSPVPRSQLFGPAAVLHNLCKNETLRKEVFKSQEFANFKQLRRNPALYPQN